MIKILYLCETLGIGGAEQLIFTTLKYIDRKKFDPVVCCIGRGGEIKEAIEKTGVRVIALGRKYGLRNIGILLELLRVFKKEKPQILHTHLFYPSYFGRIAAIFTRVPVVVVTEHGTHSNFKRRYHHWVDFILSIFTTKIIAVSEAVKRYLLAHTAIPSEKITVVYNAVDFDRFEKAYSLDQVTARKKLGFNREDFIIGCVSNLAPWKGQLILVEAFAGVKSSLPLAKLCIIGRDTLGFQKQLEVSARENNLLEDITFFGERRDIPEILKAFDLFIFPSLTEGLGISLLEAMYMGLASVASATEGVLEIVEDGKDGLLVEPGNSRAIAQKISALLEDRDKLKDLGFNAREKVKKCFSPQAYADKMESFYTGLIDR